MGIAGNYCRKIVATILGEPASKSLKLLPPCFGEDKCPMIACLFLSLLLASPVYAQSIEQTNPMEIDAEMRQFLADKIGSGLTPMQRLQSLVSAIFLDPDLKFAYASVSRSASETFKHRNGNCLSFTLMFLALARHLNLEAKFCEVKISPMFTKKGGFVILNQHLKPVVYIAGQAYSIDIFPGIIPVGLDGKIVVDRRGLAHFFSNKGVDELGSGNADLAEVYFHRALELDDSTAGAWLNLGTARFRAGKWDEAERHYRKALALNSKNMAAMNNLVAIYELTGRQKEAMRLKKKIQQFRERNPYYHFSLGLQAYMQEQYDEALVHYRQAVRLNATDHTFYYAIAQMHARIGEKDKMVTNLELAEKFASDPNNKLRYAQKLEMLKSMN
jgi:Flp pilus assembly protein TadD